jgi:hypothetical protein
LYKGASVLDFLTSPEGGLGIVPRPDLGLDWPTKIENFLRPNDSGDEAPLSSRFFLGKVGIPLHAIYAGGIYQASTFSRLVSFL